MEDTELVSDAKELVDKRSGGGFVPDNASYEDAFEAFASALGQDTAMIYRLAREVDRLTREVKLLRRETGIDRRP